MHFSIIVDGGPKTILFVMDGQICDGGEHRQFGWGRFNPNFRSANGSRSFKISPTVGNIRIYDRAIRVSEAVGNFLVEK